MPVDGRVDPRGGAVLNAIGADDRSGHDTLRDRAEHLADTPAYDVEGLAAPPVGVSQRDGQRDEDDHDDERQLPAVVGHHRQRDEQLTGVDDEEQTAELHELADGVDVGGDARDQRTSALSGLVQHREVVHVPEGAHPQRGQRALGVAGETQVGGIAGQGGRDQHGRGDEQGALDEADVDPTVAAETLVQRLLDDDRHDEPAGSRDQREQSGHPDAVAELRRQLQPAAQHVPAAGRSLAYPERRLGHRDAGAHAAGSRSEVTSSYAVTSRAYAGCLASSSAWVPRSTTRPAVMNTTSSASAIVAWR